MQHLIRLLTCFILVISCGTIFGQSFEYPVIKSNGHNTTDFVPPGWTMLDSAFGDLNKDGINDAAIILQHRDSILLINSLEDTVLTQPRILVILFKRSPGTGFTLIEQSNSFILKHDNPSMDDPYEELAISNGVLVVKFHIFYSIGSWYVTNAVYRFRYQDEQLALIGADIFSFHRATHDFEEYSYNFLTKKRALTKGNDNKGFKKTTWKIVNIPALKTLGTFSEPFTWAIESDVFL